MRLIDGDALVDAMTGACNIFDAHGADTTLARTLITIADKVPPIGGWISVKEVANIIADLFGDGCACNSNDIDEWLPQYCEYRDTDCPHPPGVACWEQYLKHLDKKPNGGG